MLIDQSPTADIYSLARREWKWKIIPSFQQILK